jgi:hypothetical protein
MVKEDGFDEGSHHADRHHARLAVSIVAVFVVVVVGVLSYLGFVGSTGLVTFGSDFSGFDPVKLHVDSSDEFFISSSVPKINSFSVTGSVEGVGKARVFLLTDKREYLVYAFDGDAKEGVSFDKMCLESCLIESSQIRGLRFDVEGMTVDIDRLTYLSHDLVDFVIDPKDVSVDAGVESVKVIPLVVRNPLAKEFRVLVYAEGDLAEYLSWKGSLVEFTARDKEKIVPITLEIPPTLRSGSYSSDIIVQFVPPDDMDFSGPAPSERLRIVVTK